MRRVVTAAPDTAITTGSRVRNLGHSSAMKAADAAASSPSRFGSPSAFPTRAPANVVRFQPVKTPSPVTQNPSLRSGWVVPDSPTAVDSSIVS